MIKTLKFPENAQPQLANEMLPQFTGEDLIEMKTAGWSRLGMVAAVVDPSNRIMMLEHKGSDKIHDGALGPIAETSQFTRSPEGLVVEPTTYTLSRCIKEELGVSDPTYLRLLAKRVGAWALNPWPIGKNYPGQFGLAISPVARIGRDAQEMLMDNFDETEEIKGIKFMDPNDIARGGLFRDGTQQWIKDVRRSGLMNNKELWPMDLPVTSPVSGWSDVKFAEMEI